MVHKTAYLISKLLRVRVAVGLFLCFCSYCQGLRGDHDVFAAFHRLWLIVRALHIVVNSSLACIFPYRVRGAAVLLVIVLRQFLFRAVIYNCVGFPYIHCDAVVCAVIGAAVAGCGDGQVCPCDEILPIHQGRLIVWVFIPAWRDSIFAHGSGAACCGGCGDSKDIAFHISPADRPCQFGKVSLILTALVNRRDGDGGFRDRYGGAL